jgi:hypothetical protein
MKKHFIISAFLLGVLSAPIVIHAEGHDSLPTASPSLSPTEHPRSTETPRPSERPRSTETPHATESPRLAQSPRPSQSPQFAGTPHPEHENEAPSTEASGKSGHIRGDKCIEVGAVLKTTDQGISTEQAKRIANYSALRDRLVALEENMASKGYNTAALKIDIASLNQKITALNTASAAYLAQLASSQQATCTDSETAFRGKLQSSRTLLKVLRTQTQDIQDYYRTTIRTDIVAIVKQHAAVSPSPSTSPTSSSVSN